MPTELFYTNQEGWFSLSIEHRQKCVAAVGPLRDRERSGHLKEPGAQRSWGPARSCWDVGSGIAVPPSDVSACPTASEGGGLSSEGES